MTPSRLTSLIRSLHRWFDSHVPPEVSPAVSPGKKLWHYKNYLFLHLACLGIFWVGVSPLAVWVAMGLYFFRMFAFTAFYHCYFSHRAFTASRVAQFVFAVLGNSAAQRGPLWWAAHHRHHHQYADTDRDVHSPSRQGLWWSHIGWLTDPRVREAPAPPRVGKPSTGAPR